MKLLERLAAVCCFVGGISYAAAVAIVAVFNPKTKPKKGEAQ